MFKSAFLVGVLGFLVLGCPGRSGGDDRELEARARYLAGIAHLQDARFGEAVLELNEAVQLDPDRVEAHHSLGESYLGLMRYTDAEASFRRALELEPGKYLSQMGLGHALRLQGRSDDAVAAYREAARLKPDHPGPRISMGEVLESMEDEAGAAEAFAEAASLMEPELAARPLARSGKALAAAGRYDEARTTYLEVLKLLPEDLDSWLGLAEASVRSGMLDEAIEAYQAASRLDPDDTITLQLLAASYEAKGDDARAVETYEDALKKEPESARLWKGLASLHLAGEREDEAAKAAAEALEHLGGDDVDLIRAVADLLAKMGDARRSAELYRLLLLEMDDDASLWIALARQLDKMGQSLELQRICARLKELGERNGVTSRDLEWCNERMRSKKQESSSR